MLLKSHHLCQVRTDLARALPFGFSGLTLTSLGELSKVFDCRSFALRLLLHVTLASIFFTEYYNNNMLEEADEDEEFHDAMEEEPPEGIVVEDVEESKEEDEDEDKDETVQHSNFSDRPPLYQSLESLRRKTQHPKQCSFEPASS